ncbi:MAG: sulfur carrier protein ThiS [Oscillospiraceae bacterium]|nr:sulfur carrier protein ThiS [Oscillospiraceae bacterium]MBR1897571.1 sulfur carrier protein ThiS [Oscillospiraceae bacterium]
MVKVNGAALDADGMTVSALLAQEQYDEKRVVVECNLEIVPKAQYAETILHDGDTVEIVSFVGGG